jgi:cytochrome c oxidase accessory protein FixG
MTTQPVSTDPPTPPRVLSTLNDDGSRRWLRPKLSPGRFLSRRRLVAYALIAVFTATPFMRINGRPVLLLDVAAREFTILGRTFLPTDTLLLAILLVGTFLTVFFVTALFGRVWCGWACPQTVYMEFVFRPIERFFTGAPGRKKNALQSGALGPTLKYALYALIAFYLANTFLAYFVGADRLWAWMHHSPLEHPSSFLLVLAVTALMLFDFAYFREQTCIVACPYGRFQSVMLDRQSLIVTYDRRRGEPRGRKRRRPASADLALPILAAAGPAPSNEPETGDCIDCKMCVVTCPTGIDIRDGLQMECIGCAQCIDACDTVMDKIGRPRGLVRYSSQEAIEGKPVRVVRPRPVVYATILTVISALFITLLIGQAPADVTLLRGVGRPFTTLDDGQIANPVRLKIVNRTRQTRRYTLQALGQSPIGIRTESPAIELAPGDSQLIPLFLTADPAAFDRGHADVTLNISDGDQFHKTIPWRLMGPASPVTPPPTIGGTP